MKQSIFIYSLSNHLKNINPVLTSHIGKVSASELLEVLSDIKPSAIIFEVKHINKLLKIITKKDAIKNRFVCVGDSLNSDDRLVLLNYNIEFIKYDKYTEVDLLFFEKQYKHSQHKVLFVEDDQDQILIITHILNNADINVMAITKGEDVLDTLKSFKPDLLLMDLYLDGITGDKLVKAIRKKPKYQHLPIVFLTSDTTIESRMVVLNAGADDLLTKPINSDLLVAALVNRMDRNDLYQTNNGATGNSETTVHNVVEYDNLSLNTFLQENSKNEQASIIWFYVKNKHFLQKKLGYSGFTSLCKTILGTMPLSGQNFDIKTKIAEGVFALASSDLDIKAAKSWVVNQQKWFSENFFSIKNESFHFEVISIILADIPSKNKISSLVFKAENILIDGVTNQKPIIILEQNVEEDRFYWIKTQIENSIKTRNLNWLYQTIVSTQDASKEIFQIMLHIVTDTGKELIADDYKDVANKTGLLRILDRFKLEHAIRLIRSGEQKETRTRALLNQTFSEFLSKPLRHKKFDVIKKLKLPSGSLLFQFSQDDAIKHNDILSEIGRELTQAKIKICLSQFDCSEKAWVVARKLNTSWIRLRPFKKNDSMLDPKESNSLGKVVRKAHVLGYKVIVTKVDDERFANDLNQFNVDFLQGNFIKVPFKKVIAK